MGSKNLRFLTGKGASFFFYFCELSRITRASMPQSSLAQIVLVMSVLGGYAAFLKQGGYINT
jgi:hypothetical protein